MEEASHQTRLVQETVEPSGRAGRGSGAHTQEIGLGSLVSIVTNDTQKGDILFQLVRIGKVLGFFSFPDYIKVN